MIRDTLDVLRGRRRIFYGWWIVVASATAVGLVNGVAFWSTSLFIAPLEAEFGWSRAEVALGFSLSLGLSGLAAPFAGRWVDQHGPRSAILIGTVAVAATYLLMATTQSLWQWYLYLSLNGLLRHFVFLIPFMALVTRWFDARRSLAASIVGAGLLAGGMAVVPVVRLLIDGLGWQGAFVVVGVLVACVVGPLGLLVIRDAPLHSGDRPTRVRDDDGGERSTPIIEGVTLREALRTPIFWALALGMTLFPFGMVTWITHATPIYESLDLSAATAAVLVSATAALSIPPRLAAGYFADRLPNLELGAAGVALLLAVAMGVLLVDSSFFGLAIFLPLFVVGFAAGGALFEALLIPRAFGIRHYATILGAVIILQTGGFVAGPALGGAIFDATGSYNWALVMMMALFAGTAACFVVASRLPRPIDRARDAAGSGTA